MWKTITEGAASIIVPAEKKISRKLPVFYNPVMKFNRDMSIALAKARGGKIRALFPLAGTGIRGIRFLLECPELIESIEMNDISPAAVNTIKKNLELNGVECRVSCKDANLFLLESSGFSYCDIDPFGTPIHFLDAACRRIARNGVLAVTATDTAALCGTYPDACRRKYWAEHSRSEWKHEIGLRILIRRVQLIGASYDKALVPIFSYSRNHYMRVFFVNNAGKKKVNGLLNKHIVWNNCGPMWSGKLNDKRMIRKMKQFFPEHEEFLDLMISEKDIIGFHDLHVIARREKWETVPGIDSVLQKIDGSRTHFCATGVKTKLSEKELIKKIKV